MKNLILGISLIAFSASAYAEKVKKPVKQPAVQQECVKPVEAPKAIESKALAFQFTGETSVNHYVFQMKQREANGGKGRGNHLAVEDSLLNFEVLGSHKGHDFGYLIGVTGNAERGENPIKENRVKVKGCWGTIVAGDTKSASDFMAVDTLAFTGGTGGVLGNYKGVINETTGTILKTDLLDKLTPKDETKVIYVSPSVYGFQVGYTYIPDGAHKGEQKLTSHSPSSNGIRTIFEDKRLSGQNFHEMVVKYKITPSDKWKVDTSGSVIFGKMRNLRSDFAALVNAERATHGIVEESVERRNLSAYAMGLVVSYDRFSIGTEFVNNRKSGQLKILQDATLGKVWTFGAGYADELNKISLVCFNSKRNLGKFENNNFGYAKARNYALTIDRQILPGLTLYAEGVLINLKNSNKHDLNHWSKTLNGFADEIVHSNKGKVLTTGTRIRF